MGEPSPDYRERQSALGVDSDPDYELPDDDDARSAGETNDTIGDTMHLMRVAQANGLYADFVALIGSLQGELAKRVAIDRSTLRTAAIETLNKILKLFQSMAISPNTRTAVDEAKTALEAIGTADLTKAAVRKGVASVLAAIHRTFSRKHFS